ncbi:NAD(P)-dependent oxidoreductase [Arthrobacter mobilis]|uniref:NAD(P)-dependent oxidoreductase n=1 Tax=Arthrobacter mobilis TaxID=2724944 RepID=A0A7X6K4A3_9MICC|nr:NAD(P)-dependent oxidoreductase [Arthrobacter mobilis]NKX54415.1 NAD(P)-dependent oxidoreductase [Arthrobacter mobilis]
MSNPAPGAPLPSVGFIGLGNMGLPMSARLAAAGYPVTGFDLDPGARARLTDAGGTAVESAADAARGAAVVILMLPSSAVVESVLADPAMKEALAPGTIVVDMSSSEPMRTAQLAGQLKAQGLNMIDAPVSGGVKGAENGTLTIMAGGPDEEFEQVRPLLEVLGKPRHISSVVGAGHALKALNNLMSAAHLWVTSEAMLIGEAFGLDATAMLEAVNGSSGRSGSTENKWPNFIVPGTYDSGFGLRLMLKDMKIATGLAAEMGVPSLLSEAAVERWQQAAEDLPPTADHTEIARWLREKQPSRPAEL